MRPARVFRLSPQEFRRKSQEICREGLESFRIQKPALVAVSGVGLYGLTQHLDVAGLALAGLHVYATL